MTDSFRCTIRIENLGRAALWDVVRVAKDASRAQYKKLARGTWIANYSGRTANDRTYYRKTLEQLRAAMESAGAPELSLDISIRMTIGRAKVDLVSIYAYWGTRPSIDIYISGRDRVAVEDFRSSLAEGITKNPGLQAHLAGRSIEISDTGISSSDSGGGEVHAGVWRWIGGIATTVIAGVILATILGILRLK
ncbi:hypothetical protein ACIRCZ_18815 [Leifsonia sp. NPDC102414]|uniref:hypothetical protein n=1 Tax=Leifsonia sp. NPDC102414 TaxID=3364124 RepID=UPI0038205015